MVGGASRKPHGRPSKPGWEASGRALLGDNDPRTPPGSNVRREMMVPGRWPARIVQTIPGSGTTNVGDTLIDENGNAWRLMSEAEASYYGSSSQTQIANIRKVRNGKIY